MERTGGGVSLAKEKGKSSEDFFWGGGRDVLLICCGVPFGSLVLKQPACVSVKMFKLWQTIGFSKTSL